MTEKRARCGYSEVPGGWAEVGKTDPETRQTLVRKVFTTECRNVVFKLD